MMKLEPIKKLDNNAKTNPFKLSSEKAMFLNWSLFLRFWSSSKSINHWLLFAHHIRLSLLNVLDFAVNHYGVYMCTATPCVHALTRAPPTTNLISDHTIYTHWIWKYDNNNNKDIYNQIYNNRLYDQTIKYHIWQKRKTYRLILHNYI